MLQMRNVVRYFTDRRDPNRRKRVWFTISENKAKRLHRQGWIEILENTYASARETVEKRNPKWSYYHEVPVELRGKPIWDIPDDRKKTSRIPSYLSKPGSKPKDGAT